VALADDAGGLEALASARLAAPRVTRVFDRALAAPRGLLPLSLPTDDPPARRGALALLLPFVGAALLLAALGGRGPVTRLAILSVGAAGALIALTERALRGGRGLPRRAGALGPRVEGVVVSAGPAGFVLAGAPPEEGASRPRLRGPGRRRRIASCCRRGGAWSSPRGRPTAGSRGLRRRTTFRLGSAAIDRGDAPRCVPPLHGKAPYRGPRPTGVRIVGEARCLFAMPGRP
jgi:hypothetical protein